MRIIRLRWRRAEYEDGLTGERYERFDRISFGIVEELFVYRDRDAAQLWDIEGAISETHNSMIHIITDPDMLTAVIDEEDAEMKTILEAIRFGLQDEICSVPALLEAA